MITNQKVIIEKWLKDHGSITGKQAMDECGVYRLSAVIFNLKEKGYDIKTNRVARKNKFGERCHFAEYKLET